MIPQWLDDILRSATRITGIPLSDFGAGPEDVRLPRQVVEALLDRIQTLEIRGREDVVRDGTKENGDFLYQRAKAVLDEIVIRRVDIDHDRDTFTLSGDGRSDVYPGATTEVTLRVVGVI